MQVTEGPLAAEVPVGVFLPHPGALSSNAGADAGDTNAASAGDTNGAGALCKLLPQFRFSLGGELTKGGKLMRSAPRLRT